jgi:hypothetical protein
MRQNKNAMHKIVISLLQNQKERNAQDCHFFVADFTLANQITIYQVSQKYKATL